MNFWSKESLLYFWGWPVGERVGSCSKTNSTLSPLNISEQEPLMGSFRQKKGATYRNSIVRIDSHLEIGYMVVLSCLLDCFKYGWSSHPGSVPFIYLFWQQFSGSWQLTSWLQSSHPVVNFFHLLGVSISTNSTKDMAQGIICDPWGGSKGPWLCLMSKLLLKINIF